MAGGRSSGGGGRSFGGGARVYAGSRPAPRPAPRRRDDDRSPPPKTVNHALPPAPAPASNGAAYGGVLAATIAQGVAFGTGSAVAHRTADAVMGPRTIQHETVVSEAASSAGDACGNHSKAFQDCLNSNGSDMSKCQFYLDKLNECRRNPGSLMGA